MLRKALNTKLLKSLVLGISLIFFANVIPVLSQSESGSVNVEIGVGDTVLQIDGKTSPLSTVNILENSTVIGTTNSDVLGNFSKTLTAQESGIRNISLYAITSSHGTTDTITHNVNVVKHATTTLNVFLPATINLSHTSVDQGQSITLSGQGYPNSTVILTLDSNQNFNTPTDINGVWEFVLDTTPLGGGNHSIVLVVQDAFANISSPSSARNFVVNVEEEAEEEGFLPPISEFISGVVEPAPGLQLVVSIPTILSPFSLLNLFSATAAFMLSLLRNPLLIFLITMLALIFIYLIQRWLYKNFPLHPFVHKRSREDKEL